MIEVVLEVPDDMLVALKLTPERFRDEVRLAAAVKLLELGRLSAGAAARLAGLPVPVFLHEVGLLDLLRLRYGAITIPPAVSAELTLLLGRDTERPRKVAGPQLADLAQLRVGEELPFEVAEPPPHCCILFLPNCLSGN